VIWFRRALLELWAMIVVAAIVGFLGPFGTYLDGDFLSRVSRWSLMLMGAYVMIRPVLLFCRWLEWVTHLPRGFIVFSGTIVSSFPMALIWLWNAPRETRQLSGYGGLLPFAMLCACLVLAVVWWAERADAHMRLYYRDGLPMLAGRDDVVADTPPPREVAPVNSERQANGQPAGKVPRLRARLSRGFSGDILALESEDHYVRVHGSRQSELLLIRLRDAIVEMDGCPGVQTHRSWWVARDAVADTVVTGRSREIRLTNGLRVPVARDSVYRLQQSGFLPA
jgi:hypothetical protein